ncbi:MAG: hypothetical protein BGO86_08095 [Chryseobacterium sp. 36-9]|mgnify:CR=1 FL=1|nr:MAG: hypothetical protein BGO86_08095 [Chryseobacterium sp. 36-9]
MEKYFNLVFNYKRLLIANILVLLSKCIVILFFKEQFSVFEDYTIAVNLIKYHQYSEFINLGSTAYKLPIYPLFVSVFVYLFNSEALRYAAVAQSALFFLVPVLMCKITRFFNQEKVGIAAGYLFLLSPAYYFYSFIIEATNIFVPLFLYWIYLYLKIWFRDSGSFKGYIFFSFISGILFLTQVVVIPIAGILILSLLIFKKINFKNLILISFGTVLFYSPWVIRNYVVFDKIIISKTPVWQNIYFGFKDNVQFFNDLKLIPLKRDETLYEMRNEHDEFIYEKVFKNEVRKVTNFEPHFFVKKAVGNFICLWYVPLKYYNDNSLSVLVTRKLYIIVLNILTIISLVFLYRRSKLLFYFSLLFFANFTFPYLIGHAANIRFKLDFEWYQLILVSYLLVILYQKSKQKKNVIS